MTYDVQYFIKKFTAIPEEKWCMNLYEMDGKCCALGLCGERGNKDSVEASALRKLINGRFGEGAVTQINDGRHAQFQGGTPKSRILAALHIIAEGK